MPYMKTAPVPLLEERVWLADGTVLWIRLAGRAGALRFRLEAKRDAVCLLCYENESPRGARRHLAGQMAPYAFRSVEQLRYDFERDLETL